MFPKAVFVMLQVRSSARRGAMQRVLPFRVQASSPVVDSSVAHCFVGATTSSEFSCE